VGPAILIVVIATVSLGPGLWIRDRVLGAQNISPSGVFYIQACREGIPFGSLHPAILTV
jgi:hypothetical protein